MVFVCAHIVLLCRASPRSLRSFEHLVSSGKHLSGMCSLICWLNLNNQFSNLIIKCTENFRNVARYLEVIEFRLHFHCMFGFAFFPLFLRRESVYATAKQKVMEKKYTPFFCLVYWRDLEEFPFHHWIIHVWFFSSHKSQPKWEQKDALLIDHIPNVCHCLIFGSRLNWSDYGLLSSNKSGDLSIFVSNTLVTHQANRISPLTWLNSIRLFLTAAECFQYFFFYIDHRMCWI